jgi:hypothetical protein
MIKQLTLITALACLTGCATQNIQIYGSVDVSNKSVTVQPGSEGIKGKLKQALANDGWSLVVYRGASVMEGEVGEKTKVQQYDTFNSRYRLVASSHQFDVCLNFEPAIKYDISFIDNKTGAEVFTIDGKGCESDVVEGFMNALKGKNEE